MNELIDTMGIASMLGLTRHYTTDRIIKRPDFPKPKIAISQKTKRWSREDIERWASAPRSSRPA